jgi:hypothetical protein
MTLFAALARALMTLTLAMTLAACGHSPPVSVTSGEARAIEPPEFEVRGATTFDQRWIDATVEAGVTGLGWPRPKPRPANLDKPFEPPPVAKPPVKKKKRGLLKRLIGGKNGDA